MGVLNKQGAPNFPKNEEMFVFGKIWRALFSWNTLFKIRPFPLLLTKWFNPFSPVLLWKIDIWKKCNLKRSYLKDWDESKVNTKIFRKFIWFSSRQPDFLCVLPSWIYGRRLNPIQPLALLSAALTTQSVQVFCFTTHASWWAN